MGADFMLYTEIKRNDEWHALNGMFYSEEAKEYVLAKTYWNGSRSYFSRTYDKLRDIGKEINKKELSEEVRKNEDWMGEDDDDFGISIISVNWNDFLAAIPNTKRKELSGFVPKRDIWEYEVEGGEIDYVLTGEEYKKLTEEEKKEYEFYEWDDPFGWFSHMKEIAEKVRHEISSYMDVNNMWDEPEQIRVVCITSW